VKNVAAKQSSKPWRGYSVHTRSWESIVGFYHDLIWNDWPMLPMLSVVEAMASSPAASQIHGATSMDALLLSDCEDFRMGNTLEITYQLDERTFHFHHRSFSGHDDGKICSEAEVMQTLRLFLRLKYGILFEIPEP
jgi:hypothetical protein